MASAPVCKSLQALHDELGLGRLDDALAAQHGGVGDTALDIVLRHAGIKGDGGIEIVDAFILLFGKASGPKFIHGNAPLLSLE